MQKSVTPQTGLVTKNRLLAMLPEEEFRRLLPQLEVVNTSFKEVIYERDKPVEFIYFPQTSVFSVLSFTQEGSAAGVGAIGNEGFTGIEVLIGGRIATDTKLCMVAGSSLRMRAADFQDAVQGDTRLRSATLCFLRTYLRLLSQSVVCNRLHTIEEQFARWILMTHDRVNSNEFYLTQEFLADMLGAQRPSISVVARTFQRAGLIQYSRGNMVVRDRNGLEESSCECYWAVRKHMHRAFEE